jgi:hypothetical protein
MRNLRKFSEYVTKFATLGGCEIKKTNKLAKSMIAVWSKSKLKWLRIILAFLRLYDFSGSDFSAPDFSGHNSEFPGPKSDFSGHNSDFSGPFF